MAEDDEPESIEYGVLPDGWYGIETDQERKGFENHVHREIAPGHQLERAELRTLARCARCDDVLYLVNGTEFAVVHLTWSGQRETISRLPRTYIFPSFHAFVEAYTESEGDS